MNNIPQMQKYAQMMKEKMEQLQQKSQNTEYEAQAGGGAVKIILNGEIELKKIIIDKSVMNPDDTEILSDLIIAAFNEAKKKADSSKNDIMSNTLGGMLPPGFKFPF